MSTVEIAGIQGGLSAPDGVPKALPSLVRMGVMPRTQGGLKQRHLWEKRYAQRLRLTDATIVILAVTAGYLMQTTVHGETDSVWAYMRAPLIVIPVWLLLLSLFGSRSSYHFGSGSSEYKRVAHSTGFAFGAIAITFVIFQWPGLRIQLLAALPLGLFGLLLSRWAWRRWLVQQRTLGHCAYRAIVVGTEDDIRYVVQRLEDSGQLGYRVVGIATDTPNIQHLRGATKLYPVVGSLNAVATIARNLAADAVIVASRPPHDPDYVKRLSWQLEGTAAELILSSRLADVAGPRISLRPVDGMPLIHVRIPQFEGSRLVLKRAFDIAMSAVALAALAPVGLIVALAIKLDSRGPVLFRQTRIGLNGNEFAMMKFRSMRKSAESEVVDLRSLNQGAGPLFKMRNDPRVTRVGRFIRKYSIDELPQFWNVLRGDMSVVGPRPPLSSEVMQYHEDVFRRFYIKPGITGLWALHR